MDRVGTVAVTFRIPGEAGASSAALTGEFTGWSAVPMAPTADGGHEVTVELPSGASYRFRYLLDGERWANDWAADDYTANEYGSDDSVVIVDAIDGSSGNRTSGNGTPTDRKSGARTATTTDTTNASR